MSHEGHLLGAAKMSAEGHLLGAAKTAHEGKIAREHGQGMEVNNKNIASMNDLNCFTA